MVMNQFSSIAPQKLRLRQNLSVWLPDAQCRLVASQPELDQMLWNEYLDGALRTYRKHGVEAVLDLDDIRDGRDTQIFFAATDSSGDVVGGARVIGPLQSADESHAVVEWEGSHGLRAVREMITDRLPFGVVEVKTAWADSGTHHSGAITTALARIALPIMALLDVQFVMATAAAHVLDRWRSSGGVVAARIPAAAYPDDRYQTKMMWWDRTTLANQAEPKQLSRMLVETQNLVHHKDAFDDVTIASVGAVQ